MKILRLFLIVLIFTAVALGQAWAGDWSIPDANLAAYFRAETERIAANCLADVRSLEDWKSQREERRRQLLDMLGLWPMPERTDLRPEVTGQIERDGIVVEKLHFQSLPGLYVTANLYRPSAVTAPRPAILYVCGHALVKTKGISYGNKVGYQHHGVWFAQHGYVCLLIDTIQLGEIEGIHHGTHRENRWWWNARGYTPAGVEAWNSMRAIDYLQTRPDVDRDRIGMTGRSGGGSYTWTTAALDERVKVAAPVAGITDMQNQVVDGCVEGHCDCMFFLNTHRWDFAMNAALLAPRPLLIVNSDADSIFPLDGVQRIHKASRRIYGLHGAADNLGLVIAPGPHKDTQDLQVPVFRWFNRHLKNSDPPIERAAVKLFSPEELKVFATLPEDERVRRIDESFVSSADPARRPSLEEIRTKCFAAWPSPLEPPKPRVLTDVNRSGVRLQVFEFESQPHVPLRLFVMRPPNSKRVESPKLNVLDEKGWGEFARWFRAAEEGKDLGNLPVTLVKNGHVEAWVAPRGIGPSHWIGDAGKQTQIRRRFMLLGQTLDGMRVWDIVRAVDALRQVEGLENTHLTLDASGPMGVNALYAGLFAKDLVGVRLRDLPSTLREGPDYFSALRVADLPGAIDLARERLVVEIDRK